MRVWRRGASAEIMSETSKRTAGSSHNELKADYELDYGKSRPNRFAQRMGENAVAVVLEPDVAEVFDSSASVNRMLRSVISAMPGRARRARTIRRKAG